MATKTASPWTRRIARAAIAAAILVLIAGPLIKYGLLGWQAGLAMFALGAIFAGIGGIVSLVAVLRRRGGLLTVVAAAAGIAGLAVPVGIIVNAGGKPQIHNITTDTANPPEFVAITADVRGPNTNAIGYDAALAPQQQAAYPDLKPLIIARPPAAAFELATSAALQQGWAGRPQQRRAFRSRQKSSLLLAVSEYGMAGAWAGTAALLVQGSAFAALTAVLALAILAGSRAMFRQR